MRRLVVLEPRTNCLPVEIAPLGLAADNLECRHVGQGGHGDAVVKRKRAAETGIKAGDSLIRKKPLFEVFSNKPFLPPSGNNAVRPAASTGGRSRP
jgi:hypothetical protein